jgi:hypothetical protein
VTETQVMVANIHLKCTLHYSTAHVYFTSFQPSFHGQNLGPWHRSLRRVSSNYIRNERSRDTRQTPSIFCVVYFTPRVDVILFLLCTH